MPVGGAPLAPRTQRALWNARIDPAGAASFSPRNHRQVEYASVGPSYQTYFAASTITTATTTANTAICAQKLLARPWLFCSCMVMKTLPRIGSILAQGLLGPRIYKVRASASVASHGNEDAFLGRVFGNPSCDPGARDRATQKTAPNG